MKNFFLGGLTAMLALGFLAMGSLTAKAQDGAMLYQTKTCVACHGKDAKTPLLPEYPKISGQNEKYIVNQMMDIKTGKRNNGNSAAMQGVMSLVSEAEIQAIAKWLATLK